MTYKILIKNTQAKLKNLWEIYGTTSTTGSIVTFTEYSTEDVNELQNTIAELDKTIGFENIRVIADVTYNVGVTVDEIKTTTPSEDNHLKE
mgnify:CR=1 FL=1|jgi:hypothetical protein